MRDLVEGAIVQRVSSVRNGNEGTKDTETKAMPEPCSVLLGSLHHTSKSPHLWTCRKQRMFNNSSTCDADGSTCPYPSGFPIPRAEHKRDRRTVSN